MRTGASRSATLGREKTMRARRKLSLDRGFASEVHRSTTRRCSARVVEWSSEGFVDLALLLLKSKQGVARGKISNLLEFACPPTIREERSQQRYVRVRPCFCPLVWGGATVGPAGGHRSMMSTPSGITGYGGCSVEKNDVERLLFGQVA